jgi:hypothetical protein
MLRQQAAEFRNGAPHGRREAPQKWTWLDKVPLPRKVRRLAEKYVPLGFQLDSIGMA